ncbi:class I SAM-dependent methyltransferase [Ornithinibacillus contaminans]|uniref:class I SAM-dependent methyltransferase n=1 Tax=Ornithinibacillus contaminans TaxID=694055 RepID=UPI00064DDBB3|nr:class I SAM-dependent methyltransferase [Ornithinibacillus contaminans]
MANIKEIRLEEKSYHDYCYDNYALFEAGSWLHKPVQTVIDLFPFFEDYETMKVLDLGSGVGRNSIPIAEMIRDNGKTGAVVCVDLLQSAIEKLTTYSAQFAVEDMISTHRSSIEEFRIAENSYDLIVAVSSLEHVESIDQLDDVLKRMAVGTKKHGINCIIINSEVEEIDQNTKESLDVKMEINATKEEMFHRLEMAYGGWIVLKKLVRPLEYSINRGGRDIQLNTSAITYVVRK